MGINTHPRSRIEYGTVPSDNWYGSSGTVMGHSVSVITNADAPDTYHVNITPHPELWAWELRVSYWYPVDLFINNIRPVVVPGRQLVVTYRPPTSVAEIDAISNADPRASNGKHKVARDVLTAAMFPFTSIDLLDIDESVRAGCVSEMVYWHPFISPAPNCPVLPYR